MVRSDITQFQEQALWVIANLTGESPKTSSIAVNTMRVTEILEFVNKLMCSGTNMKSEIFELLIWIVHNLSKCEKYLSDNEFEKIVGCVEAMCFCSAVK
jgi:hypothetical protein